MIRYENWLDMKMKSEITWNASMILSNWNIEIYLNLSKSFISDYTKDISLLKLIYKYLYNF